MVSKIKSQGFGEFMLHTANSAAAISRPDLAFDQVRIGILQFGLWPSDETMRYFLKGHTIQDYDNTVSPVLSWKTRITQVKKIRDDTLVGYGGSYQAKKGDRLAIIPAGQSLPALIKRLP